MFQPRPIWKQANKDLCLFSTESWENSIKTTKEFIESHRTKTDSLQYKLISSYWLFSFLAHAVYSECFFFWHTFLCTRDSEQQRERDFPEREYVCFSPSLFLFCLFCSVLSLALQNTPESVKSTKEIAFFSFPFRPPHPKTGKTKREKKKITHLFFRDNRKCEETKLWFREFPSGTPNANHNSVHCPLFKKPISSKERNSRLEMRMGIRLKNLHCVWMESDTSSWLWPDGLQLPTPHPS